MSGTQNRRRSKCYKHLSDVFIVKHLIRLMEIFKNLSSSPYSCTVQDPQ